jgi:endonuclease/exonuclease/phosphatase family metal-dependent hydrolase
MQENVFSLLTYNIHKGFGVGKLRFLLPKMRAAIEMLSPDFVFLQEVQGRHDKQEKKVSDWPKESQSDFVGANHWPHVVYGKNATYQAGHHGNAILSKYPLIFHENINISRIQRASRGLLHGTVMIADVDVHLLCVHLGLFKEERHKQVQKITERIEANIPNDTPLVLAGDFNDWRKDLFKALEERLGLKEAVKEVDGDHAKSFPALKPALHTDRIYYRGIKLETAKCLSGKPWRMLSDHLPLYARFRIER